MQHEQGRTTQSRELLSSVYDRFTEGFDTADLKAATALLTDFRTTRDMDELDRHTAGRVAQRSIPFLMLRGNKKIHQRRADGPKRRSPHHVGGRSSSRRGSRSSVGIVTQRRCNRIRAPQAATRTAAGRALHLDAAAMVLDLLAAEGEDLLH